MDVDGGQWGARRAKSLCQQRRRHNYGHQRGGRICHCSITCDNINSNADVDAGVNDDARNSIANYSKSPHQLRISGNFGNFKPSIKPRSLSKDITSFSTILRKVGSFSLAKGYT
uniref:Uncharacterized protein n=1 Tax=Romanomermis culicivorax TaxID=13658 RepID=A0A915J0E5_ROMCU